MAADLIDIATLTQPVSEAQPHGSDLREDASPTSAYYRIKDARNAARAAERASLFDPEAASGILKEWKPILELAPGILKDQAKDLEVVSWYIEALVRFHDFAGLRAGFSLARSLVEQYWDGLYPLPDEDGIETRVAPLAGLNGESGEGTLLAPMRNALITPDVAGGGFSYWQYQQARDAGKIADEDKRAEKLAILGFSPSDIQQAVNTAPDAFYQTLVNDLETAAADYRAMNDQLRKHCGNLAPPFSLILETLEEITRTVRFLAKDKLASQEATPAVASDVGTASTNVPSSAPRASTGPIASREDALRKLEEVAAFFRATEPHTPLVSGIERLVRWGRMSMAELITELVPDPTARAFYEHLTGANFNPAGSHDSAAYANIANTAVTLPATSSGSAQESSEEGNSMRW